MHALQSGPLASYNSLQDEHLAEFYSHPRRLRHLRRMGLITKDGDIVDEGTLRLNNALKQQKKSTKDALANSVVNKAIEIERQTRIEIRRKLELLAKYEMAERVKRHVQHPVGVDDGFTPYPTQELPSTQPRQMNSVTHRALRLGIDESLIASYMQTTAQLRKIISMRAPPSPYITKSFSMPIVPHPPLKPKPPTSTPHKLIRKKPKTSSCVEVSGIVSRRYPMRSHVRVTMCYVGKSVHLEGSVDHDVMDVTILQQHCGGNTVCVFKNKVKPKSWFTFTSRRHKDCPFGISIYLDAMFDCRLSTCCEYKHQPGKMLGSKTSHFGLVKVEGGTPCYKCQGVIDLVSPTSMSKTTNERAKPPVVTNEDQLRTKPPESDDEFDVDDIVKRYKDQPTNSSDAAVEYDDNSFDSPNNTGELEDKDDITNHQQQEESNNENDGEKVLANFIHDTAGSSKEDSIEPSKRRSVIFSPDTKELDSDEPSNRQSLSTSQTIKDAKEILKKASSGYSITLESDRSDNDILSSSSASAEVDMLESRVSQLESGLITEHPQPESKDDQNTSKLLGDQSTSKLSGDQSTSKVSDDQSTSKLLDDQSTSKLLDNQSLSKVADSSNTPKASASVKNSNQDSSSSSSSGSSSRSGSHSEVEQSNIPSDQKLVDDQSSHQQNVNTSGGDHKSTSQLSKPDQTSSHSLDISKPLDVSHSTTEVDQNVSQHDQQSSKDDQSTPSLSETKEIDQTNNQHDQSINHSDQDADQVNNQQSQSNDHSEQDNQDNKLDNQSNLTSSQHDEETNPSDQGTYKHDQEKSHQSESTSDPTEQDHNAS